MKKALLIGGGSLTLIVILVLSFLYFGNYSTGVRAGTVVKVSKRGYLFKTMEGQLNLGTFGASNNSSSPVSQIFEFSIAPKHEDVYKKLEEAALTGKRVRIDYEEKYTTFFWVGETAYFATNVTIEP
ncbi:MAG: hypothetical protein SFU91_12220 [Chloroherpetonaceae bacterium]|nr:hypothetical protein [Chloroherpetonaceae bacterium]